MAVRDAVLAAPTAATDLEKPMVQVEMARRLVYMAHGRADHGLDPKLALQFRQKVVAATVELISGYTADSGGKVYRRVIIKVVQRSPELISKMHPQFPAATLMRKCAKKMFENLSRRIRDNFMGNMDGLMVGHDSDGRPFYSFA